MELSYIQQLNEGEITDRFQAFSNTSRGGMERVDLKR